MEEEKIVEMSTLNDMIPRYHKGYDMDILIGKMQDQEPLTKEEKDILKEAYSIYPAKQFEENRKRFEELKQMPGHKRHFIRYSRVEWDENGNMRPIK